MINSKYFNRHFYNEIFCLCLKGHRRFCQSLNKRDFYFEVLGASVQLDRLPLRGCFLCRVCLHYGMLTNDFHQSCICLHYLKLTNSPTFSMKTGNARLKSTPRFCRAALAWRHECGDADAAFGFCFCRQLRSVCHVRRFSQHQCQCWD